MFWDVTLCGWVSGFRRFEKTYCLRNVENPSQIPEDLNHQTLRILYLTTYNAPVTKVNLCSVFMSVNNLSTISVIDYLKCNHSLLRQMPEG